MKKQTIMTILLTMTLLAGCGKDPADSYDTKMSAVITEVSNTTAALDAIDPSAPDASDTVLAKLSELSASLHEAATLEMPSEYSDCEAPISNAATYMTKAYETYAQACSAEPFDAEAAGIAIGYYESSMESLARLGELLKSHETGN